MVTNDTKQLIISIGLLLGILIIACGFCIMIYYTGYSTGYNDGYGKGVDHVITYIGNRSMIDLSSK